MGEAAPYFDRERFDEMHHIARSGFDLNRSGRFISGGMSFYEGVARYCEARS